MSDPFSASAIALACIPAIAGVVAGVIVYKVAPETYYSLKSSLVDTFYETRACSLAQHPKLATNVLRFMAAANKNMNSTPSVLLYIDENHYSIPLNMDIEVNGCWINFIVKLNHQDEAVSISVSTFKRNSSLFGFLTIDVERVKKFESFILECTKQVPLLRPLKQMPGKPKNNHSGHIIDKDKGVGRIIMRSRQNLPPESNTKQRTSTNYVLDKHMADNADNADNADFADFTTSVF